MTRPWLDLRPAVNSNRRPTGSSKSPATWRALSTVQGSIRKPLPYAMFSPPVTTPTEVSGNGGSIVWRSSASKIAAAALLARLQSAIGNRWRHMAVELAGSVFACPCRQRRFGPFAFDQAAGDDPISLIRIRAAPTSRSPTASAVFRPSSTCR